MEAIRGEGVAYSYEFDGSDRLALDDIAISVASGELVAILGANGCGKSTLVKHFNALLRPQRGRLFVLGMDTCEGGAVRELRRRCGMVFQNPDNQFVSSVVEEDVAFGLENYDTPAAEIPTRVAAALALVGMSGFEKRAPHTLSGGQKQRVAIAGVLAMEPEVVIFDEATAMLDPEGRAEVLDVIGRLHRQGRTIVMITHYCEEAIGADRIYLMSGGRRLAEGTPREILTDRELLRQAGLEPPIAARLYYDLADRGIQLCSCPLTAAELAEVICR